MPINLTGPGASLNSGVLIYDAVKVSGGSNDGVDTLTKVGNPPAPIAAALEIKSTLGALVLPRMTSAQKNALTPVTDGMAVYDTDLGAMSLMSNGAWGNGTFMETTVSVPSAAILNLNTQSFKLIQGINNKIILVSRYAISYAFNTTAYTNGGGGDVSLQYGTVSGGYVASSSASNSILATNITAGANTFAFTQGSAGVLAATSKTTVVGASVYLTKATSNFAAGDGSLTVKIWYTIVNSF